MASLLVSPPLRVLLTYRVSPSNRTKSYDIIDTALPRFYGATVDDSAGEGNVARSRHIAG